MSMMVHKQERPPKHYWYPVPEAAFAAVLLFWPWGIWGWTGEFWYLGSLVLFAGLAGLAATAGGSSHRH